MTEAQSTEGRVIVSLSGGLASAWCAHWALSHYPKERVLLYFNDTKWEDKDLYRFLSDLETYFNHSIFVDADGRNPEQLFRDKHALANNQMPFCSRMLKAERLQKFYQEGDTLVFGIGPHEMARAKRLVAMYQKVAVKRNKTCKLEFPLIKERVGKAHVLMFIHEAKIKIPRLYELGFEHNNCGGGCVRSGVGQWRHLLATLPEVYAERERVEEEFREKTGKDVHYLKTITLKQLRENIESQGYFEFQYPDENHEVVTDCIGICDTFI